MTSLIRPVAAAVAITLSLAVISPAIAQTAPDWAAPRSAAQARLLQDQLVSLVSYAGGRPGERADEAAQITALYAAIARANRRAAELERQGRAAAAELVRTVSELNALRARVAELQARATRRETEVDAELSAIRAGLAEQMVTQAGPEKRVALQRFADGDRVGAKPILDEIFDIEVRAQDVAARKRKAVLRRQQATLNDVMLQMGEIDSLTALAGWEEVVRYAPDDAAAWFRVGSIRRTVGRVAAAEAAFETVDRVAAGSWEKAQALSALIVIQQDRRNAGLYTDRDIELYRRLHKRLDIPFREDEFRAEAKADTGSDDARALGQMLIDATPAADDTTDQRWSLVISGHLALALVDAVDERASDARAHLLAARTLRKTKAAAFTSPRQRLELDGRLAYAEASILAQRKQWTAAAGRYREALRDWDALRLMDPQDMRIVQLTGATWGMLAEAEAERGRLDPARKAQEMGLQFRTDFYRTDTDSLAALSQLRWSLEAYVQICRKASAFEACRTYLRSLENGFPPRDASLPRGDRRVFLAVTLTNAEATLHYLEGDLDQTEACVVRLESLLRGGLSPRGQKLNSFDKNWATALSWRGTIARDRGHKPQALEAFSDAFELLYAFNDATRVEDEVFSREDYIGGLNLMIEIARLDPSDDVWRNILSWVDRALKEGVLRPEHFDARTRFEVDAARRRLGTPTNERRP